MSWRLMTDNLMLVEMQIGHAGNKVQGHWEDWRNCEVGSRPSSGKAETEATEKEGAARRDPRERVT